MRFGRMMVQHAAGTQHRTVTIKRQRLLFVLKALISCREALRRERPVALF